MGFEMDVTEGDSIESWCGEMLPAPVEGGKRAPAGMFLTGLPEDQPEALLSDLLSVLVRMYPDDPSILGPAARFAWKRLNLSGLAEELFERARRLDGLLERTGLGFVGRGSVSSDYAKFLAESGRPGEGAAVLEEALAASWDLSGVVRHAAFLAKHVPERQDEALLLLESQLGQGETDDVRALVYHEYGKLLRGMGRLEDAIANLEIAFTISPTFQHRVRIVTALMEEGSPESLARACQLSIDELSSDPEEYEVKTAILVAFYLDHASEPLMAIADRFVEKPDASPDLLSFYAVYVDAISRNRARASELFRRAGASTSTDPSVVLLFADWSWESLGARDVAGVAYRRAIELQPDSAVAHARLAQLSFVAGDSESGASAALEAARLGALEGEYCLFAYLPDRREEAGRRLKTAVERQRDSREGARRLKAVLHRGAVGAAYLARPVGTDPSRIPLLESLAKVLNGQAPAAVLDQFPEWDALPLEPQQ